MNMRSLIRRFKKTLQILTLTPVAGVVAAVLIQVSLMTPESLHAGEAGEVIRVENSKILFTYFEPLEAGDVVSVRGPSGTETATAKVIKGRGKKWIAALIRGVAKAGDKIEMSLDGSEPETPDLDDSPTPSARSSDSKSNASFRKFSVGLVLGADEKLAFKEANLTFASRKYSGEVEFALEPPVGLLLEYRDMQRNRWGFQVGVLLELNREMKSVTERWDGASSTTTFSSKPKLRSEVAQLNAVYCWNTFYIPFGLNYSFPHYTPASSSAKIDVTGGVGGQLGIGFQFSDVFGLEVVSQAIAYRMKISAAGGEGDFGSGFTSGIRLLGKFAF